tara:strand:- start:1552 stop:1680 length:129 start_codon:yes stop_codon:yes gene_type:complete
MKYFGLSYTEIRKLTRRERQLFQKIAIEDANNAKENAASESN